MGTNYYHVPQAPCTCCGRPYESRHVGKQSYGWEFLFASYPEAKINSAADWRREFMRGHIEDEYGRCIGFVEFWATVNDSRGKRTMAKDPHARNPDLFEYADAEGYRISKWHNFS